MPAFTPITIDAMRTLIDNYIINNTANAITPAEIRGILQTILDFCLTYFGNQAIQDIDAGSGAFTFDVQNGANANVTLTKPTTTLSIANLNAGQYCTLILTQGTGSNALVFDDPTKYQVVNDGAGVVTLSPGVDAIDVVSLFKMTNGKCLVMIGINFTNA